MSKRNATLFVCGILLVVIVGNISVRRYQHHQAQQKTLEIDLGGYNIDRLSRPKPDEGSIAAARAYAKREIAKKRWGKRDIMSVARAIAKSNEASIAAAQRLAKEVVSHPEKEIFIITWSNSSDDFSYQVIVKYDRPAHSLAISRKETSIYMTEDRKVTTLIHEFAKVTDDRITVLSTNHEPLQNLPLYNCTQVGGQGNLSF